jgi:membrane protein YdbS with pleckstrin-like domain
MTIESPVLHQRTTAQIAPKAPVSASAGATPTLTAIDPRMRLFWGLQYMALGAVLSIPLGMLGVLNLISDMSFAISLPLVLLLGATYGIAAVRAFGYALLDDGLWITSGVFWKSHVFVPRERIQHLEVSQGPLDRKLDLARLSVHTAGMHVRHLSIEGVSRATAHALRDEVLARQRELSNA